MKLKDFIKTVLAEANAGIKEYEQETNRVTWLDDSIRQTRGIEFDLAVTAGSDGEKADVKIVKDGANRIKFTIVVLDNHPDE